MVSRVYVEGKWDSRYVDRIIEFFDIENVTVVPCHGKEKAINVYSENKENSYLVIDYDLGIPKKILNLKEEHIKNVVCLKIDFEHCFWGKKGNLMTKKEKRDFAIKFSLLDDDKILIILQNLEDKKMEELTHSTSGTNLLEVISIMLSK